MLCVSKEGKRPVFFKYILLLSKTFYVYNCLKIAKPLVKLKYLLIIDSALVLWRKGEIVFKIMKLKKREILSW